MKNPAAFLQYVKSGIADVYLSATDGVTIKAGLKEME